MTQPEEPNEEEFQKKLAELCKQTLQQETGCGLSTTQQMMNDSTLVDLLNSQEESNSSSSKKKELPQQEPFTSKDTLNSKMPAKSDGSKTTSMQEHTTTPGVVLKKKRSPIVVKPKHVSKAACPSDSESLQDAQRWTPEKKEKKHSTSSENAKSNSKTCHQDSSSTKASSMQPDTSCQQRSDPNVKSKSSRLSEEQELENPTPATSLQEPTSLLIREMAGLVERTLKETIFSGTNSRAAFHFQISSSSWMDIAVNWQLKDPSSLPVTPESSLHQM